MKITSLADLFNEKYLVYGLEDGTVKLIDLEKGKERFKQNIEDVEIRSISFSKSGNHLMAWNRLGENKTWDLSDGEILPVKIETYDDKLRIQQCFISNQSDYIFLNSSTCLHFQNKNNKPTFTAITNNENENLEADAIGVCEEKILLDDFGKVHLWDIKNSKFLKTIKIPHVDTILSEFGYNGISPSGNYYFFYWDGMSVYNLESGKADLLYNRSGLGVSMRDVVVSDQGLLAAGSKDGYLYLFNTKGDLILDKKILKHQLKKSNGVFPEKSSPFAPKNPN